MENKDPNIKEWEEIVEKLADIEHRQWANWQTWMHGRGFVSYAISPENEFDSANYFLINKDYIDGWEKQINTPYSELSEREKQSDRDQVKRYLPLIQEIVEKAYQRGRPNEIKISMLRQWLNEDHISDPAKMVTNSQIKHWLK